MDVKAIVSEVRRLMNRPEEDDLFDFPGTYLSSVTRARDQTRRKIASAYPNLLYEEEVIQTSDGGKTYQLTGDHLGEMEVWTPPGPNKGHLLATITPEGESNGFYLAGRDLHLKRPKAFSPGLYIRWIPASKDALTIESEGTDLPVYVDWFIVYMAAYDMAQTPGVLMDAESFRTRANREWRGDENDPSDGGILGIIRRQSATQFTETIPHGHRPWYRGISR